jgi:hypothetical protein
MVEWLTWSKVIVAAAPLSGRRVLVFIASRQAVGVHECRRRNNAEKRYYKNMEIMGDAYGFYR